MTFENLLIEHRGAVSWLYLNREQALNAISSECMQELRQGLEALRDRAETRVLVISGKGRAFCAGADLRGAREPAADEPPGPGFLDHATAMEEVLNTISKPVIAAVNGICCGGGLELALMCDFILASDTARIGDAHANFGAMPGGGASVRLPRVVGLNTARLLMLTGDLLSAEEMRQAGLVARVYAAETFEREVQALAERIAQKSPLGLATMKRLLQDGLDMPLGQALRAEKLACAAHMRSWDAQEGGHAFMEKRKPEFRGY